MNTIKVIPTATGGDDIVLGGSKMWGNPDLPSSFSFPTYKDEEGDECHYLFVAQINCLEMAPYDLEGRLPHQGMLYFFAKIEYYMGDYLTDPIGEGFWDKGDVKVLYYPKNDFENFDQVILIDDDDVEIAPKEQKITFESKDEKFGLEYEHKLLGHPPYIADDIDPDKYALLFQLDSCDVQEDLVLNFMDWGMLYFLIPVEDLSKPSFKNVVGYLASS